MEVKEAENTKNLFMILVSCSTLAVQDNNKLSSKDASCPSEVRATSGAT